MPERVIRAGRVAAYPFIPKQDGDVYRPFPKVLGYLKRTRGNLINTAPIRLQGGQGVCLEVLLGGFLHNAILVQ